MRVVRYNYIETQDGKKFKVDKQVLYGVAKKKDLPDDAKIIGSTKLKQLSDKEKEKEKYDSLVHEDIEYKVKDRYFGYTRGYLNTNEGYIKVKRGILIPILLLLMLVLVLSLRSCSPEDIPDNLLKIAEGEDKIDKIPDYSDYLDVPGYDKVASFTADNPYLELSNPNEKGTYYLQFKLYFNEVEFYSSDLLNGGDILNANVYEKSQGGEGSLKLLITPYDKDQKVCSVPVEQIIEVK